MFVLEQRRGTNQAQDRQLPVHLLTNDTFRCPRPASTTKRLSSTKTRPCWNALNNLISVPGLRFLWSPAFSRQADHQRQPPKNHEQARIIGAALGIVSDFGGVDVPFPLSHLAGRMNSKLRPTETTTASYSRPDGMSNCSTSFHSYFEYRGIVRFEPLG